MMHTHRNISEFLGIRMARSALRFQPPIGMIYLRRQAMYWLEDDLLKYPKIDFYALGWKASSGHVVHFDQNYRCLDPYGNNDQRLQHLGYTLTVWANHVGATNSAKAQEVREVDLLSTIERLAKESLRR